MLCSVVKKQYSRGRNASFEFLRVTIRTIRYQESMNTGGYGKARLIKLCWATPFASYSFVTYRHRFDGEDHSEVPVEWHEDKGVHGGHGRNDYQVLHDLAPRVPERPTR